MKVNMTPNPLDVVTIHASQGDSEARQWEFELHNNGELIDTSNVTEQMFFKAYKGGTEQILPVNTSTPTTSPFIGDIRYPQGLLTDQEFTYRQSPTEEDGLAKITDVKGNTIVWNQLVQNGNFADSSRWASVGSATINSVSNNVINVTTSATAQSGISNANITMVQSHKYLFVGTVKTTGQTYISISGVGSVLFNTNSFVTKSNIFTWTSASGSWACMIRNWDANSATFEAKNVMLFDLTQMGMDISASEFTSLFPLSYYAYDSGSLLSFNGSGIKTVGKNLYVGSPSFDDFVNRDRYTLADETYNGHEVIYKSEEWYGVYKDILVKANVTYTFSSMVKCSAPTRINIYNKNSDILEWKTIGTEWTRISATFTPSQDIVDRLRVESNSTNTVYLSEYQLEIGSSATDYEPYTSSTLSLPISTYFPTGMKSAGSVRDELTDNKAITRLIKTTVDGINTLVSYYGAFQGHQLFYIDVFAQTYVNYSNMANLKSNHYLTATNVTMNDRYIRYQASDNRTNIGRIYWNDDRYTSADAMNTALQSDPLEIISLAQAPTETSFTTASLVTENTEIPLSNEDGVLIGKCTEELSAEPGFHDAKIKLSDSDGTCYSNKIQLHVERSPQ